jgi:16S rRNA processing protein RimM
MTPREHIRVGVIIGAHGIRGEVKLKSFTADPKAIATYGTLMSEKGEAFEISRIKPQTEDFICTLKNVTDRNKAESLKGTALFINRYQLPKNELYLHDLIGAPIFNGETLLGRIIAFENFGAGDLMDVQIEGRAETVLIPYNKTFVLEAAANKVVITLPDGYLDDEKQPN